MTTRLTTSSKARVGLLSLNVEEIFADAMPFVAERAQQITQDANFNTSARAGFTFEEYETFVLLGPTGAAGLPVEIGTWILSPRRPFKRALDANRHR